MRVLIVGAGLGGLCLAQGLRRAGVDVDVYEKDPGITARFQGYRIGLSEVGQEALHACLPKRWQPLLDAVLGDASGPRLILDPSLNPAGEIPSPTSEASRATMADRHVLRQLLLAGLDDRVHTGKRLTGFQTQADGGVRAEFADGTAATGDLLVGADGINSAVRARLVDVAPTDTGVRCVIGRTMLDERFTPLVPGFGTIVSDGGASMMLGLMRFRRQPTQAAAELAPEVRLPDVGDYLRWVFFPPPGVTLDTPPGASHRVVRRYLDGWHEDLRALVDAADPENSTPLAIRVVQLGAARWPSGPVTLLGDAAHATSPSGGNGANTALLDAQLLSGHLGEVVQGGRSLRDAVDDYERQMLHYGAEAVAESLAALSKFGSPVTGAAGVPAGT
ncbi:FAD-dependent oxidoreductase [Streptomyces sp. NPDC090442]|uniref:FAD-dependent oxidoreductase n=1 Tax=Streptomyces sp. NPDC090442 TaxID=3365962 RepID=UPI00380F0E39